MSRDPDEIRQEIDQTREELGETLEAIGARVAPGHVAQRVKDDVDDRLDVLGDKVSPARILRRRTEGLRTTLRDLYQTATTGDGDGAAGGAAAVADRVRQACSTAAQEVSSAPPSRQALAAFAGGLAATAVLPSFARRRLRVLLLGAAVAAFAIVQQPAPGSVGAAGAPSTAGTASVGAEGLESPTASS